MKNEVSKKPKGFIQGILLFGIALMAVVIGAFALSGRDSKKSTSAEEAKANSAAILSQSATLATAIERMLADRPLVKYDFSRDIFKATDATQSATIGLFNPTDSYAVPQLVPAKAFFNDIQVNAPIQTTFNDTSTNTSYKAGSWGLNRTAMVNGAKSHIIYVEGLDLETCNRITFSLYNQAEFKGTGTIANLNAANVAIVTSNITDRTNIGDLFEGCVLRNTTGEHSYFKIVFRE